MSSKKETKEEKRARNRQEFLENRKKALAEKKLKKDAKIKKIKGLAKFAKKKIEYSDKLSQKICELIEAGLSLRDIGKIDGMPSPSTIVRWTIEHENFEKRYARSKDIAVDIEFDEMKEIADETPPVIYDKYGNEIFDKSAILWSQLRIDVRKFRTVKLNRKKYGDHIAIDDPKDSDAVIDVPRRESREEWLSKQTN